MSFKIYLCFIIVLFASLVSCKKKPVEPIITTSSLSNGMLVLNEGLFQQNNSSLSWVNFNDGQSNNSFFEQKTNRGLGDTGNDMARYHGKVYVVVNVSSTIEILDAHNGTSVKQISMFNGNSAKQPRSIAFHGAKAYISCYDGFVDVLDTASLTITQRIPVGSNPEGVAVSNGNLYVANSGGLNFPHADSTISVIQLATHTEIGRITVGKNPGTVVAANGAIYVISRGNYSSIPSQMHKINPQTNTKTNTYAFAASGISAMNQSLLISYLDANDQSQIGLFNCLSDQLEIPQFINTNAIQTVYGISYSDVNGRIYVSDANGYTTTGYVNEFSGTGTFLRSFHVGLNPSKVIIYE